MNFSKPIVGFIFLLLFVSIAASPALAQAYNPFTHAYTTMSNSRFSFKGVISGSVAAGAASATIKTSGQSDNNTSNLFTGETLCFNGNEGYGCKNQATSYSVTNVPSTSLINFTPVMTGTLMDGDSIVSTQSGTLTVSFTPATTVPANGTLVLTIPAAPSCPPSNSNCYYDGIPDSTGFDAAALMQAVGLGGAAGNLTSGPCAGTNCFAPTGFTVSAVNASSALGSHTVQIVLSSSLTSGSNYSFRIGNTTANSPFRFLNPTPTGTTHTRGVADTYSITLQSKDNGGTVLDQSITKVAPIDGVQVSANVELSISYVINPATTTYVNGSSQITPATTITQCNNGTAFTTSANVTSTATAVPFGSITSFSNFYYAAQTHYVSTNAQAGYTVTVQSNGLLTSGANTIPNTSCDSGPCTVSTAQPWTSASNNGFGYTVADITGTDATSGFGANAGTYFKQFDSAAPQTIMSNTGTTATSRAVSCYKLSVSNTQSTGYYTNKLTYVATPRF